MKITNFIELHYRVGELYMEFIKDGCMEKGEQRSWCKETKWIGPKFERVPEPHPDSQRKGHYMDVFETRNYVDEAKKVCRYLQHLEEQRTAALIRSREKQLNKQQRKSRSYVDKNWKQLVRDGTIRSLTIN